MRGRPRSSIPHLGAGKSRLGLPKAAFDKAWEGRGEIARSPKLPEGYRLDLASDPDAPALRRPDGVVVARFSRRGGTEWEMAREAWEDLLRGGEGPQDGSLVPCFRPA